MVNYYIAREREFIALWDNNESCFCDDHGYNDGLWFTMFRQLLPKMIHAICTYDFYFLQRPDATRSLGLSSIQNV